MALAAVATAIVACNKVNTEIQQTTPSEEGFYYTFSLGEPATKAVLDSDENGRFVKWTDGDQLGSITTKSQGFSNITPATTETPAQFQIYSSKGLTEGNTINVWFPYRGTQTDATEVELQIPNEQTQRSEDGEFDFKAMPMIAKQVTVTAEMATTTNPSPISTIDMEYLGSVINFKVFSTKDTYASEKVQKITFNGRNAANTSDANIGGVFTKNLVTIDPENEESMRITEFKTGYSSIVTSPLSASAIGANKDSALDLYMVIAPGEFSGSVVVTTDAAEYTYTLSAAKTFVRGGFKAFGLDLGSATCTRELNGYDIPASIDFKNQNNVDYVQITGADYYSTNASFFYGSALRFDASEEQIVIPTKSAFGDISIVALYNTSSTPTSTLRVYGSKDGSSYSEIGAPSFTHGTNVTNAPDAVVVTNTNTAYRYIKMVFTKGTGNLAVGSISLVAPDDTPRIEVTPEEITNVSYKGIADADNLSFVLQYLDGISANIACDGSVVTDATDVNGIIIYSVSKNTGSAREGLIKITAGSVEKQVVVSQNAAPSYDITLGNISDGKVYVGANESDEVSFTVKSNYLWTASCNYNSGIADSFLIDPEGGNANDEIDDVATITVTAYEANETDVERFLGNIIIDNGEANATVQVWQESPTTEKTLQDLFTQSFGINTGSATGWSTTYSIKGGVTAVYQGASESVLEAKVSKNTMGNGSSSSALVSSQGKTGSYIVGPLNVSDCEELVVSNCYGMSSSSWASASFMKCYYSVNGSTYTEVTNSETTKPSKAVSNNANYVSASYSLPSGAISSTLYLKFEFYCNQTNKKGQEIGQAYFDDVRLVGKK